MNIKLSFTPVSQTPLDLLVVVLDDETRRCTRWTIPALAAHLERAAAGFREKTQKREYFATLPEGSAARALVVYWSPQPQELEPVGEREDVHRARAAPGPRLPPRAHVAWPLNAADAAPLVGKVVGGRGDRRLHLRPLQAGEGRVPAEGGAAHDRRAPRPPGRRGGAQGALRLGLREREPGPRPHQRAGRRRARRSSSPTARRRSPRRSASRSRSSTPPGSRRAATRAACAWARAARTRRAWSSCATCRARRRRRRSRSSARASPSTPAASA